MRGDMHDPELNRLSVTVGEVRVSPDLKLATAYVLPLGGRGAGRGDRLLARNKTELRRIIGKKLALKFTPDLRFRSTRHSTRWTRPARLFAQDEVRRDVDG